jgi:hypothetical protein
MGKIAKPRNVTFPAIIDYSVGRGSVVNIGIRFRLDGPEIKSLWGRSENSAPARPILVIHTASNTMDTGSFSGVNHSRCGVDQSPNLAPRLKKESGYTYTLL